MDQDAQGQGDVLGGQRSGETTGQGKEGARRGTAQNTQRDQPCGSILGETLCSWDSQSFRKVTRSPKMLWGIIFLAEVRKGGEFGTEMAKGEGDSKPFSL